MAVDPKTPRDLALARLERKYGKGIIVNLDAVPEQFPAISTTHPGLDWALGGGWGVGKIIELYGMESSGKTTLAIHSGGWVQRHPVNTGRVLYVDHENSFDKFYANRLGMQTDTKHFDLAQPDCAEDGLDVMNEYIEFELADLIIVDSVAAMLPRSEMVGDEYKGEMGKFGIGMHARVISQGLKQLVAKVHKKSVTIIFINQIRNKIGRRMTVETTTGGNALKFYASQRVEIRKSKAIVDGKSIVGMQCRMKVAKNKMAIPFRECPFNMRLGYGIDGLGSIMNAAALSNVIKKTRQGFYELDAFGIQDKPRGDAAMADFLKGNADLLGKIVAKINWEDVALATAKTPSSDAGDEDDSPPDTALGGEGDLASIAEVPAV